MHGIDAYRSKFTAMGVTENNILEALRIDIRKIDNALECGRSRIPDSPDHCANACKFILFHVALA